jgi:hypothetical protein
VDLFVLGSELFGGEIEPQRGAEHPSAQLDQPKARQVRK